jgi:hypothetical protein
VSPIQIAQKISKIQRQRFFVSHPVYRAIKLICNQVFHAFESVCGYLNYTLDLLYKRTIKRQLKAKMVASLKQDIIYPIIVTINAENVLHVIPSTNEPFV